MWQVKEIVPEGIKNYLRPVTAKVRHPSYFVGSPLAGDSVIPGRGSYVVRVAHPSNGVRLGDFSDGDCGAILRSEELGRSCSIGPYARIGPPEHPISFLSTLTKLYAPDNLFGAPAQWNHCPDPPRIGSDVWSGAFALVRQRVRIGHGAVVGAGAIVTHKVPPCGIAAGVPARVIRFRFAADLAAEPLETRWRERSTDELAADPPRFPMPWKGATCCEVAR
jgi:acetyltransferase-like isoleucine patch superfamily enzyme